MYNPLARNRPDVSICLLTWNRKQGLEATLTALYAALDRTLKHEILIYDNGSNDGTEDVLQRFSSKPETTIIYGKRNLGLNSYKKLFNRAKGRIIIDMDDDVIELPNHFDRTLVNYIDTYTDYCFIALNVVQNENTKLCEGAGGKPIDGPYTDDVRGDKTVERGPAGGWCAAFRGKDYLKIAPVYNCLKFSHRRCEDGALLGCFMKLLRYKYHGLVKNAVCLHATGPYYAKLFGQTKREIEKYTAAKLYDVASAFK